MIDVRIVSKPSFRVSGIKTWISGQNNEEFAAFWRKSNSERITEKLKRMVQPAVMEEALLGISRVEKNPDNRTFFFYIACETQIEDAALESFTVPTSEWAVFSNHGENLGQALFEAEMFCHLTWLKNQPYDHALAPEMEVYPVNDSTLVEYWLPVVRK